MTPSRSLCFALLALLASCADETAGLPISRWSLGVGGQTTEVSVPVHLSVPDEAREYTLSAEVDLPSTLARKPVCLLLPSLEAGVEATIDGRAAVPLVSSMAQPYRAPGPQLFCIDSLEPGLHSIVLRVVHLWEHSAWIESTPRMLERAAGERAFRARQLLVEVCAIFGSMWMGAVGFGHLIIFLFDRRRKAYGWFVAQAFTAAYYPAFVSGGTQWVFGPFDAPLVTIIITAAPLVSLYFTHDYFGLERVPRFIPVWFIGVCLLALAAPNNLAAVRWAGPVMAATVNLTVLYQLVRLGRLALAGRTNALFFALAWLFLGATAWLDSWLWAGIVPWAGGIRLASIGLWLFSMLQSAALSRDYSIALRVADERATSLQTETNEVTRLNSELRRQIFERSKTLTTALLRMQEGPAELKIGDVVGERYKIIRPLGAGGMGDVFLVERTADEHFALKVMKAEEQRRNGARFTREAQILTQMTHRHVVGIVDAGLDVSGHLFLVMELVNGKPLSSLSARYGDVPWALSLLSQLADGMAALHAGRIVHRDLKPANIMIEERDHQPWVKVTDFGISSLGLDESSPDQLPTGELKAAQLPQPPHLDTAQPISTIDPGQHLTRTGVILGTMPYLAPELSFAGSRQALPDVDVFSYGVIAYEMLGQGHPFAEPVAMAKMMGRALAPAKPLTAAGVPPELAMLLHRCLALDPADRPTAEQLSRAFAQHRGHAGTP